MHTLGFIGPITTWWEGLSTAGQMFYGIGLLAGFISIILAVLSVLGMDQSDGFEAIGAHYSDAFSLKPLVGFFLGFGLSGGMALDAGATLFVALAIAVVTGGVLMAVVIVMYRAILAMRSDGTVRIADAVGATGTVYITLPPRKAQGGQVIVNFKGRQETFAALNNSEVTIPSGDKVKVVGVLDTRTVLVEPI